MSDLRAKLDEFTRLPPGWDSYGAMTPTAEARDRCVRLLDALEARAAGTVPEPWVVPGRNGSIQLEWDGRPRMRYLEMEASAEGWLCLYNNDDGTGEHEAHVDDAGALRLALLVIAGVR